MTYGNWSDVFHAYRMIWNFEAKKCLYSDIEIENKEKAMTGHVESVMNL